jgi:hypothetical protein
MRIVMARIMTRRADRFTGLGGSESPLEIVGKRLV